MAPEPSQEQRTKLEGWDCLFLSMKSSAVVPKSFKALLAPFNFYYSWCDIVTEISRLRRVVSFTPPANISVW